MGSNPFRTRSQVCESQVACDGSLVVRRKSATICLACEQRLARKNRPPKPLKGAKLYPEDTDV